MRLFEAFVEALQDQPVKTYGGYVQRGNTKTALGGDVSAGNMGLKAEMLEKLEETQVYILSMDAIFPKKIYSEELKTDDGQAYQESALGLDRDIDLDVAPPFQTCWFQFAEPGHGAFNGLVDTHEGICIFGMWLHEVGVHEYKFCFVMEDKDDPGLRRFRFGSASRIKNHQLWHTIALWLQPFGRPSTVGTVRTSDRVKFRHPKTGEKIIHKIRKVIMVYPKKMSPEDRVKAEDDGVDFSHRFSVQGHYRQIKGIGKNRQGEYCVQGYTYVREHEKGPEHLPMTKKTRVVLGDTSNESK